MATSSVAVNEPHTVASQKHMYGVAATVSVASVPSPGPYRSSSCGSVSEYDCEIYQLMIPFTSIVEAEHMEKCN